MLIQWHAWQTSLCPCKGWPLLIFFLHYMTDLLGSWLLRTLNRSRLSHTGNICRFCPRVSFSMSSKVTGRKKRLRILFTFIRIHCSVTSFMCFGVPGWSNGFSTLLTCKSSLHFEFLHVSEVTEGTKSFYTLLTYIVSHHCEFFSCFLWVLDQQDAFPDCLHEKVFSPMWILHATSGN
jgi:hypothetical protein